MALDDENETHAHMLLIDVYRERIKAVDVAFDFARTDAEQKHAKALVYELVAETLANFTRIADASAAAARNTVELVKRLERVEAELKRQGAPADALVAPGPDYSQLVEGT